MSAACSVVACGDSVTLGVRVDVTEPQTFRALLQQRLRASGLAVTVHNAGVGGSTTRDGLARFDRDVLERRPALVLLMFGLNDACLVAPGGEPQPGPRVPLDAYRGNLTTMTERARAAGAAVLLATPTPMTPAWPYAGVGDYVTLGVNHQVARYAAAVRELAAERGLPLVDGYRLFTSRPDGATLIPDGCHPSVAGHRLLAEALEEPVRRALADHLAPGGASSSPANRAGPRQSGDGGPTEAA